MSRFGESRFGEGQLESPQEQESNQKVGGFRFGNEVFGGDGQVVPDKPVWRIKRNNKSYEAEGNIFDAEIVDTANPFGNYAIFKVDDNNGQKFEQYSRGTRVDFEISDDGGITFQNRFTGYVVEVRELDQQGADALEVECYSFDQFLRRDTVTNDQTGNTILGALEDIVTTDTPVTWDASNVEIVDDQELTQSFRGEKVENVLQALTSKSGNEDFGVNSDTEFYFRPRESGPAPRNIDNSQWFNYDIPKLGKETVNEVTVYFNDGDESVTVDNGSDKLQLQNNLGTAKPVTAATEVNRPDITNIDDARDVAQQILSDRESTLTGTVTTYDLYTAEPGQVIDIEIIPRGINGQFRIAELHYKYGRAETDIEIVEKKGEQDELLVRMSDTVKRNEMQDVDRDATGNIITSTNLRAEINGAGSVAGTGFSNSRITNTARNKLRNAWAGDGPINITEIAVGNDGSSPSRSDTSLGNELERVSVSESLPDSTSVLYEGDVSTTNIREIGLFDASGDLISRATIPDTSLSGTVSVDYALSVSDDSPDNNIITNDGLTAVRDCLADNSPDLPADYAYGSGDTKPAATDTNLENSVASTSLEDQVVQYADTADDFRSILPEFAADRPIGFDELNGEIDLLQVCWFGEAEDLDNLAPIYTDTGSLSGDEGRELTTSGEFVELEITPEYDVPANELDVRTIANAYSFDGQYSIYFNGNKLTDTTFSGVSFQNNTTGGFGSVNDTILEAGSSHTYRIEADTVNSGSFVVDCMFAYDDRFTINTSPTFDSGTASFNGPELYPEVEQVTFDTENTRRDVTAGRLTQQWNDTSNNQYLELSNDNGNTWNRVNNSDTANVTFANANTNITARIGLSRWTAESLTTPTNGDSGQSVGFHVLDADIDTITTNGIGAANVGAVFSPDEITTTIRECGEQAATGDLLTRSVFADKQVTNQQRIVSSETIEWANP